MKDFYQFIRDLADSPFGFFVGLAIFAGSIAFPGFWYIAIEKKSAIEAGLVEIPNVGSSGTHWGKPGSAGVEK